MNALHQQEQELVAGKEQIVDILNRIEEEKVRFVKMKWQFLINPRSLKNICIKSSISWLMPNGTSMMESPNCGVA